MTFHCVASGETGAKWSGQGPSVGCNDVAKWGYPVDYLVLLNTPSQFQHSRLDDIKKTRFETLYTTIPSVWRNCYCNHFTQALIIVVKTKIEELFIRKWSPSTKLSKNYVYHSKTSPLVAMSLAYNMGATEIVLWGVDFKTHHRYREGQQYFFGEMRQYQTFIQALEKAGVKVYLGAEGSTLQNIVPIWKSSQ